MAFYTSTVCHDPCLDLGPERGPEGGPERVAPSSRSAPPRTLLRLAGRAIAAYDMIRAGDRVLLGLSGGKDSLALLHVLRQLQRAAPIRFDLACATIDPMVEGFDPGALIPYVQDTLGLPYFYERQPIMARAEAHLGKPSFCAFCSRMKRGALYAIARREGFNVLALAHHLDDLAETFLMSAFYGGRLRTMRAHYRNDAGDVRVIRPFVHVRERQTRAYAEAASLPVIRDNCPACFRMPTERAHAKALLAQEEARNSRLFMSLRRTLAPLIAGQQLGAQQTQADCPAG